MSMPGYSGQQQQQLPAQPPMPSTTVTSGEPCLNSLAAGPESEQEKAFSQGSCVWHVAVQRLQHLLDEVVGLGGLCGEGSACEPAQSLADGAPPAGELG